MPASRDSAAARKARGAFFTPEAIARYLADWGIRTPDDRVLEPACGEAAFLVAAGRRLAALGSSAMQLEGHELHPASAARATEVLAAHGLTARITTEDFFGVTPAPRFDAVLGNPPYVRYQAFRGESRAVARAAALRAGVQLTNLASSWAAFTVHASLFVRPGGRLGLVLPAELLSVNYAAPVRTYLMNRFARVRLVLFAERVFPDVLEEVVLLLADGLDEGPTAHCELIQARNADDLADPGQITRWEPRGADRWSAVHLDEATRRAYTAMLHDQGCAPLAQWGQTTLGMVTGRNTYFALTGAEARRRGLVDECLRISPPGSRHLRQQALSATDVTALDVAGRRTWLFRPEAEPSAAARRYIRLGEREGVQTAYKCRVRSPWWRVPYLRPADLLLTYMNADTARLCTNSAGVHHLNSVHGVYLAPEHRDLGMRYLPLAALNSISLLGAELVGRSYGGGVLKLEPREADRWPMPSPALIAARANGLDSVRERVGVLVAAGRLFDASALIDEALYAGQPPPGLPELRAARQRLHERRTARGGSR
ncbi:MAG: N-6 DNA methylase [Austwickia sp.]|nr:N-6 DNA methylase [Austwickia sp.]